MALLVVWDMCGYHNNFLSIYSYAKIDVVKLIVESEW